MSTHCLDVSNSISPYCCCRFRVREANKDDKRDQRRSNWMFVERIRAGNLIHQTYYCTLNQLVLVGSMQGFRQMEKWGHSAEPFILFFLLNGHPLFGVHQHHQICVILANKNPITPSPCSYFANTPPTEPQKKLRNVYFINNPPFGLRALCCVNCAWWWDLMSIDSSWQLAQCIPLGLHPSFV